MIVVADSGPLHYLILLDQTELLPRFYGQVIVPEAVLGELTSGKAPQPVKEWLSKPPSWLRVQAVPSSQLELVTDDLDLGGPPAPPRPGFAVGGSSEGKVTPSALLVPA
jgi:predicted nucleic acid-binding protein